MENRNSKIDDMELILQKLNTIGEILDSISQTLEDLRDELDVNFDTITTRLS